MKISVFQFVLIPFLVFPWTPLRSLPQSSVPHKYLYMWIRSFQQLLPFEAEQSQLSQMLKSLIIALCWTLQYVCLLYWEAHNWT